MQQEAHCRLSQPVELHARALPGPRRLSHREVTLLRDQLLFDRQAQPERDHSQGNPCRSGAAARSRAACGVIREDDVLELYHSINSVCAQKARMRDEIAPFHSRTSLARAMNTSDKETPSEAAVL